MEERIVYLNGEYLKESEAKLSINDRGFLFGDAAYDLACSFKHKPFLLDYHVERLYRSLRYIQIDPGLTPEQMYDITMEVFERNKKLLAPNEDYRLEMRVSRGVRSKVFLHSDVKPKPTVLIHNTLVSYEDFARFYIDGVPLIVASTRLAPAQCLDPKSKLQSKLSHILAELEALRTDPDAIAVMLDINGIVAEGSRMNIFIVSKGKVLTPTRMMCLPGVSRLTTLQLAQKLDIETAETDLCVHDLYNADEIFITASSYRILPVSKIDLIPVKSCPGPITKQLIKAWGELLGGDLVERAMSHLPPEERRVLV